MIISIQAIKVMKNFAYLDSYFEPALLFLGHLIIMLIMFTPVSNFTVKDKRAIT